MARKVVHKAHSFFKDESMSSYFVRDFIVRDLAQQRGEMGWNPFEPCVPISFFPLLKISNFYKRSLRDWSIEMAKKALEIIKSLVVVGYGQTPTKTLEQHIDVVTQLGDLRHTASQPTAGS